MMRKIGIMQPYFFPYLGYFSLIQNTDHFVFFDTSQYEPRSWMNRNRIINLTEGFTYISVPVNKSPQKTPINCITIANTENWQKKILSQLSVYKKRAPHYDEVISFLQDVFCTKYNLLAELNISSIKQTCNYLGIELNYDVFSTMQLGIEKVNAPDEWALEITKKLGYDTYVNPPGGMTFFDKNKYLDAGIDLEFLKLELIPYVQRIGRFEAGLSIIDVMMFCTGAEIREMLMKYELL